MDIDKLLKQFTEEYIEAPLYGGFSRTLKKKIASKQQVKMAFIENISIIGKVYPETGDRVNAILKSFE